MRTESSDDGTTIAYEAEGSGPLVVVVGGAFNDRRTWAGLAAALAEQGFTAVSYDRRGRGDSGDAAAGALRRRGARGRRPGRRRGSGRRPGSGGALSSGGARARTAAQPGVPFSHLVTHEVGADAGHRVTAIGPLLFRRFAGDRPP